MSLPKHQRTRWQIAVDEADKIWQMPNVQRIEAFEILVKEELKIIADMKNNLSFSPSIQISSTPKQSGLKTKHSNNETQVFPIQKRIKLENVESSYRASRDRRIIPPKIISVKKIDKIVRKDSIDSQSSGFSETSRETKENALTTFEMIMLADKNKNYLFKNVSKELVCFFCYKPNDLIKCVGRCLRLAHKQCHLSQLSLRSKILQNKTKTIIIENSDKLEDFHVTGNLTPVSIDSGIDEIITDFKCQNCLEDNIPECFVCLKKDDEPRLFCKLDSCGKYFHEKCLQYWPQANIDFDNKCLTCPSHLCQTCTSDDPKRKFISLPKENIKCILCPSAYHKDSRCIPAGTEFLSQTQIICPKHWVKQKHIAHNNWCFFCGDNGGEIVCCDTCPITVHKECLPIDVTIDERYICEECESGRLPLYGEIVWVKYASFRYWPSIILPPIGIPDNMRNKKRLHGDVCVKFFGTNDYGWSGRGRIYIYEEDDYKTEKIDRDVSFQKSLEEANEMFLLIKTNCTKDRRLDLQLPISYKHIKTNRLIYPVKREDLFSETHLCNCKKTDDEPCGINSSCINRLTYFLCNKDDCLAGEKCCNKVFGERYQPKVAVRPFSGKGFGLITLEPIKAGSFIIEYVGDVIDDTEFKKRFNKLIQERENNFYFFSINQKYRIDAGPCGNESRFINHSCYPNCITQKWNASFGQTRVGIFANRDIEKVFFFYFLIFDRFFFLFFFLYFLE